MLRIIVISLFVANLLLLAFQGNKLAVQPEVAATPAPVDKSNIPTIHLFNELAQDQELMSGNRQCFSLGPFHSSQDRDTVRDQLLGASATISERETQALVEKGFWVFIPPYGSLLEANHELIMLQARGLKDIRVMYEGEWKNAISLGYFLRQENAKRRKKSLEDRGYAPQILVQRHTEARYWLDFEQIPGSDLIALDMSARPNDFMQRALPCPQDRPFDIADGSADPEEDVAPAFIFESDSGLQRADTVEIDTVPGAEMSPGDSMDSPAENSAVTSPDDKLGIAPENSAATQPDDSTEAGPAQSVEPEPQTGSEEETDGG